MPPIWIERPQEASFQEWLKEPQFSYWQLEGEGGIGKTSLLERFRDRAAGAKKVAILMPADQCITEAGQDGVNLLLNLDIENAPAFEKVKAILTNARSTLKAVLQSAGEQVSSHWDALSELAQMEVGDEAGTIMKGVRDIASVIKAIKGAGDSGQRDIILKSPEESLLKALAEDVKKGGVWLIDTWEKDTKDQISSRLAFPQPGRLRTPAKAEAQKYTLQQWLDGISSWLRAQGAKCLFAVAGRMAPRELGGERPPVRGVQTRAKPLTMPEIRQFLEQGLPDLDHGAAPLSALADRTGGLPILMLWVVRLVENEVRENPAWNWAQWPTLLPAFEQDERQGLIHYAIDRIVQHQTGITDIWKLALVDILNREILGILFPGHEDGLIDRLERSGIIHRPRHDPNTWTIHDTSHEALECYAEHKGLLDPSRNRDLHRQLGLHFDAKAGWNDAHHSPAYQKAAGSDVSLRIWRPKGLFPDYQPWLRRAAQQWALFGLAPMQPVNGKDERRNIVRRIIGNGMMSIASMRGLAGDFLDSDQIELEKINDIYAIFGGIDPGFHMTDSFILDRLATASCPQDLRDVDFSDILNKYSQSQAVLREIIICPHIDFYVKEKSIKLMQALDTVGPFDLGLLAMWLKQIDAKSDNVNKLTQRARKKFLSNLELTGSFLKCAADSRRSSPDSINQYANFLFEINNDHDSAEKYYKKSLDINPENADSNLYYAIFLWKAKGNIDAAEALYRKAIDIDPKHAKALGSYACFMWVVRAETNAAEDLFKRAVDADPTNTFTLTEYAYFKWRICRDIELAEIFYNRCIQLEPENAKFLKNYAFFLSEGRSNLDAAEAAYKQAVEMDPEDADSLDALAFFIWQVRSDKDTAEILFKRAVDANPIHARSLSDYAYFLWKSRKDIAAADALYQRSIKASSGATLFLSNYALFLTTVSPNKDEVEALYKRAIDVTPNHATALCNYAIFTQSIRGNLEAAEVLYNRAIDASPNHPKALGNYAGYLLSTHRPDDGRRFWERGIAHVSPVQPTLHLELWFYAYAHFPDRRDEAAAEIEQRLANGQRSEGWDLSANVRAALATHPDPERLVRFAEAISGLAYRG